MWETQEICKDFRRTLNGKKYFEKVGYDDVKHFRKRLSCDETSRTTE
jgi:hypothetical protein